MKKVILSLMVVALATAGAQAQKKHYSSESEGGFKFGVGLDAGIPASNLSGASFAIGADVMAEYGLTSQVAITGDAGYTRILAKSGYTDFGIVPVRVGVRVYPSASSFYFGGKIGLGFVSSDGSSFTSTAYSFGAGYKFNSMLDLGASYDGYSKNGSIGLVNFRLGYTFGK